MISILQADVRDAAILADIGRQTFLESHGHSASPADIETYLAATYTPTQFKEDLANPSHIYYKIFHHDRLAGYSKMVLHAQHSTIVMNPVAKLERLYVLKAFYPMKLGLPLLTHNINISKQHQQLGMWLFVWKENHRAVQFYLNNNFVVVGSHDFSISPTHSNPNHQMLLTYS